MSINVSLTLVFHHDLLFEGALPHQMNTMCTENWAMKAVLNRAAALLQWGHIQVNSKDRQSINNVVAHAYLGIGDTPFNNQDHAWDLKRSIGHFIAHLLKGALRHCKFNVDYDNKMVTIRIWSPDQSGNTSSTLLGGLVARTTDFDAYGLPARMTLRLVRQMSVRVLKRFFSNRTLNIQARVGQYTIFRVFLESSKFQGWNKLAALPFLLARKKLTVNELFQHRVTRRSDGQVSTAYSHPVIYVAMGAGVHPGFHYGFRVLPDQRLPVIEMLLQCQRTDISNVRLSVRTAQTFLTTKLFRAISLHRTFDIHKLTLDGGWTSVTSGCGF